MKDRLKTNYEIYSDKSENPVTTTEYIKHGDKWLDEFIATTGNVVTPEQYGAKGDGVTDDTNAINQCFSENPNSTIVFKKGTYLISNTLHAYGNTGGQTIILGGAVIKWNIVVSGTMMDCNLSSGEDSRCYILGGEFNGNNVANYGVVLNSYHARLEGTKIRDCRVAHVVVGDISPIGEARSLQAMISNILILTSNTGGAGFSDAENRIGILVTEPDNFFNNIDTLRMRKGVSLKAAGNVFNGCHFTCQYKTPLEEPFNAYAVYIDMASSTATNINDFSNCYFDNYKYCFGASKANRIHINLSNSHYFYSGVQTTGEKVYTYLCDKNVDYMSVDNMSINVSGACVFLDSYCSGSGSIQTRGYLKQDFVRDINRPNNTAYQTIMAKNYAPSGQQIQCVISNVAVNEGDVIEIANILLPAGNADSNITPIDVTYCNRSYAYHNWNIRRSVTQENWVVISNNNYEYSNSGDFYLDNSGETVTFNGVQMKKFKLVFVSRINGNLGYGHIRFNYFPFIAIYVNHNHHVFLDEYDISNATKLSLSV